MHKETINFQKEVNQRIVQNSENRNLKSAASSFMEQSIDAKYSYNFKFLGRPIIQYPQDIQALQEIVWEIKPDKIIETGIAHGGSIIYSASLLQTLDFCEGLTLSNTKRQVIAVDLDIRAHNKAEIQAHPFYPYITMFEGSSVDDRIISEIASLIEPEDKVLVLLDSNHTHDHVLLELEKYSKFVTPGSYIVAYDTVIEFLPNDTYIDREWGPGNNAYTAVELFIKQNPHFVRDKEIEDKLLFTVAPGGFLKRE